MLSFWSGITTIMASEGRFFVRRFCILDKKAKDLKSLEASIIDEMV